MALSRRGFLGLTGGIGVTASLGLAGWGFAARGGTLGEQLTSRLPLPRPFSATLPIPPVARAVRSTGDADYYEITQRTASAEILPGVRTPIFGYDGIFPGPTIESRSGRRSVVRHHNELPVPVVVHLHGGHTPAEHDGFPTDLVLPSRDADFFDHSPRAGWSFHRGPKDYVFPNEQRASTLWYHDHRMDFTGPQVYYGLAGMHIIRDDEEDALPLPNGDKDIPLMIVDRAFDADGSFRYPSIDPTLRGRPGVEQRYMEGVLGDVVLVNGAPWPVLEVSNTKYRFRILNASNARRYVLTIDPPADGDPFTQIASDGGLLAEPVGHRAIPIAPAERYDVVIDFGRYPVGTEITMRNTAGDGPAGQVMRFRVTRREREDSAIPARLSEIEPMRRADAVTTRDFEFARGEVHHGMDGWTINGRAFDPTYMHARPRLGDTEIWRFRTDFHHPVHLHLVQFQVLSRDGGEPRDTDVGWKDTVDMGAGEQVEVIARFTDYRGRYVFHCHNLEHEDMMMMAAFEVT